MLINEHCLFVYVSEVYSSKKRGGFGGHNSLEMLFWGVLVESLRDYTDYRNNALG